MLTTDLCEKELEIKLPVRLLYRYWSGQVSIAEFKDVDIAVLTTTAEKKIFFIEAFLAAASKLDVSTFKKFKASAAISKYCAGLLVLPSLIIKRLNHWEISKPNKPNKLQPNNKPSNQTGIKPNRRDQNSDREKSPESAETHGRRLFFLLRQQSVACPWKGQPHACRSSNP